MTIQQFYGIEIDDSAMMIVKTTLWISELQMLKKKTVAIIHKPLEVFPLKVVKVFKGVKGYGNLDYVAYWCKKRLIFLKVQKFGVRSSAQIQSVKE